LEIERKRIRRKTGGGPEIIMSDRPNAPERLVTLLLLGFSMIFAGIVILVAANILYSRSESTNPSIFIFVWPFPIVLAAGSNTVLLVLFAIILAVLVFIMFRMLLRESKP
jgi:uncharacterized membrane protein